jgi:GNAT superfamily N-acetyltransferase
VGQFFNFVSRVVEDWWGCRSFVRGWWRKNERDRRWVPPSYNVLSHALVRRRAPHLQRFSPMLIELDAVEQPAGRKSFVDGGLPMSAGEVRVGQVALLLNPDQGEAYAALLEVANDDESLERLLGVALERASEAGCPRLLLGAGLTPAFPTGFLLDHFHLDPPLHTAYNAPFLPDLLEGQCDPLLARRVWHVELGGAATEAAGAALEGPSGLHVEETPAARLADDLAPLLLAIWEQGAVAQAGLPPPDATEIAFLLDWWGVAPLTLLVAQLDDEPVGFALLQPDVGPAMRRARGGFPLWGRAWLALRPPQTAAQGRLLLGGVAPHAAGQGIGRVLWTASLEHARAAGWRTLAVGPVDEKSPAEAFLRSAGAQPRQRYTLYEYGGGGLDAGGWF